ncbi:MAG: acyl-CoA carboxylase epsilon subunit [Kineosporiaceae bacterium]|jgi:hypothetical protein
MTRQPVLRVINGDATPEEVAAILAIVAARSGAGGEPEWEASTSAWAAAHSHRRTQVLPGGAPAAPSEHTWRTSYWPK